MTGAEPISWDDYAAEHAITEQEAPQAFAAYLHQVSDGEWDAEVARIEDAQDPAETD